MGEEEFPPPTPIAARAVKWLSLNFISGHCFLTTVSLFVRFPWQGARHQVLR